MEHPSASIWLDDLTEELLDTDLEVKFVADTVKIRQVSLAVEIEQSHVIDAELRVSIRGRDIPRSIRYRLSAPVSWGARFEPEKKSAMISVAEGENLEKYVVRAVREILFAKRKDTLNAGLNYFATVLFTIEGHKNAYLTTENLYELPMGKTYRFRAKLVGEGLSMSSSVDIYLELEDWNRIYVNYDYAYVRAVRAIRRWFRRRIGAMFSAKSLVNLRSLLGTR